MDKLFKARRARLSSSNLDGIDVSKLYKAIFAIFLTSSSITFALTPQNITHSDSIVSIKQEVDWHEYDNDKTHSINIMSAVLMRQINDWNNILAKLAKNDLDEEHGYFSFIEEIRKGNSYGDFLQCVLTAGDKFSIGAILVFLSQIDKDYISAYEEGFVLSILEGDDLVLQEEALDAILAWDSVSQLERLRNINIPNYYLQRTLESFLEESN